MTALLVAPVVLQGAAMLVDEGWFHRRRGLPLWERIGHPLDTLTVVAVLLWALAHDPAAPGALVGYVVLAAFSCLFVTKDELVHARVAGGGEMWLHAIQFVLHPIVFLCSGLLWRAGASQVLWGQLAATALFGLYQVVYWNVPWRRRA